jgi:C4-type Zn-finger protein
MKILEEGHPWRKVTCGECKSKLEITQSDIHTEFDGRDEDGDSITFAYIICAACGHKQKGVSVPGRIRDYLRDREKYEDYDL